MKELRPLVLAGWLFLTFLLLIFAVRGIWHAEVLQSRLDRDASVASARQSLRFETSKINVDTARQILEGLLRHNDLGFYALSLRARNTVVAAVSRG